MIKRILISLICFFSAVSMTAFAKDCGQAKSIHDSDFCNSFKSVAMCHCSDALGSSVCHDMNDVYRLMLVLHHSLEDACKWQKDTNEKTCRDDWKCYLTGRDSDGKACNSNGKAC